MRIAQNRDGLKPRNMRFQSRAVLPDAGLSDSMFSRRRDGMFDVPRFSQSPHLSLLSLVLPPTELAKRAGLMPDHAHDFSLSVLQEGQFFIL